MRRRFNVTGSCNSKRNYMVSLDERSKKIKEKLRNMNFEDKELFQK